MGRGFRRSLLAAVCAGLLLAFAAPPAPGQGAPIRAIVSNGVKTVIDELKPQWEHAAGRPVTIEFGTTAALKQRIESGESFDVAVLTSEAIGDLVKDGKISGASRVELARCGIGVGIRAGAAKPDIRTVDALKKTLKKAHSVSYAAEGASRAYLDKMFEQFGIASEMKAKTVLTPSSVKSNELVRDGKAEYILTLVSEILPAAPGVELAGPLPKEVQSYVNFAGGVSANTANAQAGKEMVAFLKSPAAAAVFKAKGLEAR
ncbi:MAG TPA: substrate-binding domain-containing protein [Bryobacteraceae bacterium]|nr:substrate-binding domain-containing protein [Bryobacteraceae bacterium]